MSVTIAKSRCWRKQHYYGLLAAIILSLIPLHKSFAAGPYVVDDAGIVDPGKVQIQGWYSRSDNNDHIAVLNGAYQVLKNTELTLQETRDTQGSNKDNILSPQLKYLWYEGGKDKDIASSVVLSVDYSNNRGRFSQYFVYIPTSIAVNEFIDINTNIGWQYDTISEQNFLTYGIGSELHATLKISLIGEIFSKNDERPGEQLGLHGEVSNYVVLNAVYGRNIASGSGNTYTIGFALTF